jgi:aminoglycoside 6'-N-acetyltransferase I
MRESYVIAEVRTDVVKIIALTETDIDKCAELFMQSYNRPPWNYNFNREKARTYLNEYVERSRFVGFMLCEDDQVVGAMLGHSKTWWTNDLLFIDEFFISPERQRKGYGKLLLDHSEQYAKDQGYEVVMLMTSKHMPAMQFYKGLNYLQAEHFVFLFKPL